MNDLLKYTNGKGHLIMSVVLSVVALVMIALPYLDAGTHATGVALIMTVAGTWLVPGAARQVAENVRQQVNEALPASTDTPTL